MGDTDNTRGNEEMQKAAAGPERAAGKGGIGLPAGMEPLPDLAQRRVREQEERARKRQNRASGESPVLSTPFPVFGAPAAGEKDPSGNEKEQREKKVSARATAAATGDKERTQAQQKEPENNPGNHGGKKQLRGMIPVIGAAVILCLIAGVAIRQHSQQNWKDSAGAATLSASVPAAAEKNGTAMAASTAVPEEQSLSSGRSEDSGTAENSTESGVTEEEQGNSARDVWPAAVFTADEDTIILENPASAVMAVVDMEEDRVVSQSRREDSGNDNSVAEEGAEQTEGTRMEVKLPGTMEDLRMLQEICAAMQKENTEDIRISLEDRVLVTEAMVQAPEEEDLPVTGFTAGEEVTLEDCLYGMMVTSGEDARAAVRAAAEVEMEKSGAGAEAEEAMLLPIGSLAAAMEQVMAVPAAAEVLSTERYTTSATAAHPSGLVLDNLFLERLREQEVPGAEVMAAYAAYSEETGVCAASCAVVQDTAGQAHTCICVSTDAPDAWQCVYDHAAAFRQSAERAWSSRR